MFSKSSSGTKTIIVLFIFVGLSLYWLVSGIVALLQLGSTTDDFNTVSSIETSEGVFVHYDVKETLGCYLIVKNKINYIIPVGESGYYLVPVGNDGRYISLHVGKSLFKPLDELELSQQGGVVSCKGEIKRLDEEVQDELYQVCGKALGTTDESEIDKYVSAYCIDTTVGFNAKIMLIEAIILLAILIAMVLLVNQKIDIKYGAGKVIGWALFLLLVVFVLIMIFESHALFPGTGRYL